MICAWDALIRLLPLWLRNDVNRLGRENLQELRLRIAKPVRLVCKDQVIELNRVISAEDIAFCINTASEYSPWSAATIAKGYITAYGGHRIGICGETIIKNGIMTGIRTPTSLCIRVARDFSGISNRIDINNRSILIIGQPGCGKTTLLRDLIRRYSNSHNTAIGVVDEREELFPTFKGKGCFNTGPNTDILSGCGKKQGLELLIRTMTPSVLAVDEITSEEDCNALIQAAWCGIKLFATAHASSKNDLFSRTVYKPLLDKKIFDTLVIMLPDKSWTIERIK